MTVSYCLLLALLVANPPQSDIAVSGGDEVQFHPGLVDVNGTYVFVQIARHPTPGPNDAEFASRLTGLLQTRLEEEGIPVVAPTLDQFDEATAAGMRRILARRLDRDPNTMQFRMASVPTLQVSVDLVSCDNGNTWAMYARTSFSRQVSLSGVSLVATVWDVGPAVKSVRSARWQEGVQNVAFEQVDGFIAARKTAATQDGKTALRMPASALPRNAAGASGYPFVASRNSSVFHRAGCRMARNISEANRVEYSSRDEAVAAGKRPCRTCNP
ncbi:MAG: hypothetical protein JW993_15920 [Sedimentisphaerales bacterium]|nr:hypothetical protein [Sedimentisphaerales bacterium]